MSFYQPVAPAGSNTQIQYNKNGGFGGDADLTWDDSGKELGVGGDINLDDGGTYTTTVQVVTPTANRTISFPDATGTVGLVAGSSGQAIYNNAGALAGIATLTYDGTTVTTAGRMINSYTSVASTPAKSFTGTWFTGGTSTTTKPHVLIEPTGATSTAWSTSGTGLGVNAASGFAGNLIDLQINGSSKAVVDGSGRLLVGTSSSFASNRAVFQDNSAATGPGNILLATSSSAPGPGIALGRVRFSASNHVEAVTIDASQDVGTWTAGSSQPTRLSFWTTADGSAVPAERLRITSAGVLKVADAGNIEVGTTTGTKIGTANTQKLAFWNKTPVVQPTTSIAEATFVADSGGSIHPTSTFGGYTIAQIAQALIDVGILA